MAMDGQSNGKQSTTAKPAYKKVEDYIRESMQSKLLPPGSLLPTERELCEMFHVSRMTVRQAIMNLVNENLLFRIKGKGTFVSNLEIRKHLTIQGFSGEMLALGLTPSSRLLKLDQESPVEEVRKALQLESGEQVYHIERLRLADGRPMALEHSYLPLHLFRGLDQIDFEVSSLYDTILQKYRIPIGYLKQDIKAVRLQKEDALILLEKKHGFCLQITRTLYNRNNQPVEFSKSKYHPEKYLLSIDVIQNPV